MEQDRNLAKEITWFVHSLTHDGFYLEEFTKVIFDL